MIIDDQVLHDRADILATAGHHPFARHALWRDAPARGYRRDGAVLWLVPPERGSGADAIGPAGSVLDLVAALTAEGVLGRDSRLHLPRLDSAQVADRLAVAEHVDWDFHWTVAAPPHQPDEQRVVRLTEADHPALDALIDEAFPSTTSRPGDSRVVDWYGIRAGGRLVACGADRSRGEIGFLAGLTVAPDQRGRGLGAALTAGMTRALLARFDTVGLGVYPDNVGAVRLYRRLGFTDTHHLTSIRLA
ncbi:GNAT family N-acetyltransferase [Micromonospora sp. WMMD710]|uniref:GNAT family N-acetyltransferase n=1 Tax=Micromonospora sp. WMMD710 TaxID=3016085 RepID=UPI002417CA55|nr:GNAT family N-acetyltransferase [Micromonospora sp. WMMD710]MDG4758721.1 GNAT family N-acetyltransferase [Micromonospora sp. WMMD710]